MINNLTSPASKEKGFIISLLLSALFTYPIINSGVYYIDDLARSQTGFLGWKSLGRPLADYIFYFFSLKSRQSVDVSPLPQLISILLMALTINFASDKLFKFRSISTIVGSSLIFLNPLFLHNLVYRYDSLSMVLSISSCVFASLITLKNKKLEFIIKSALIFSSLCLYQVSAVCFIMICLIMYSSSLGQGVKVEVKRIITDLAIVVSSYSLYFILIKATTNNSRSETIFTQDNWTQLLIVNLNKFIKLYSGAFHKPIEALIVISIIASVAIYTFRIVNYRHEIKGYIQKTLAITLILTPVFLLAASISTIVILKESLILPRIATTFGVVILYAACMLHLQSKKISLFYSALVAFGSITISFALAASMHDQYQKDLLLVSQIKASIENDEILSESKTTTFGVARESLVAHNNAKIFPVVSMINSRVYDGTASIMLTRIGLNGVNFSFDRKKWMEIAISVCSVSKPRVENSDFSIYNSEKQNFVFLGTPPSQCL